MIQVRGARTICIKNWSIDKLYNKVVLFSDFIPWYKWRQGLTTIVFHALKWPDFQAPHQSKVDGCQAKKIPKHLRGVPRQQNCNLGLLSKVIFCTKRLVFSYIFLKMHYNQLVPRCSVKNKINTRYKYGLNSGKCAI